MLPVLCFVRGLLAASVDELDPVTVRIADEADQRAALADAVRLALSLDSLRLQLRKRPFEVVDADRDVAVPSAELVCASIVVERQLELLVLAGKAEEVVGRLELAVSHDVQVAPELHAERLVERSASFRIRDP